jgi:hypothetical protein
MEFLTANNSRYSDDLKAIRRSRSQAVPSHNRVAGRHRPRYPRIVKSALIVCNPEILSGTPVFAGTRVPVKNLTDYLERKR